VRLENRLYPPPSDFLVRVAQRIGVNGIPRNLAPTLDDYLRTKQTEAAE
jgi:hypothetical protein